MTGTSLWPALGTGWKPVPHQKGWTQKRLDYNRQMKAKSATSSRHGVEAAGSGHIVDFP